MIQFLIPKKNSRIFSLLIMVLTFSIIFTHHEPLNFLNSPDISLEFPFDQQFENENTLISSAHEINSQLSSFDENSSIKYNIEKMEESIVDASQTLNFFTPNESQFHFQSNIRNISFEINSYPNLTGSHWANSPNIGDGDVNITKFTSSEESFYRLNFSDTGESIIYGTVNELFNSISIPSIFNHSTIVQFSFRIPYLSSELTNSLHRLELELNFINRSLIFVLSNYGWNYGAEVEENIVKGTNALYIMCNQSESIEWYHFSINITRLIQTYFNPEEFSLFSHIESLYCNMLSMVPRYELLLDFKQIIFNTQLEPLFPLNYTIGSYETFCFDGTLFYNTTIGNVSISIEEQSSWEKNLRTILNIKVKRIFIYNSIIELSNWNSTHLELLMKIENQILLSNYQSFFVIIIPSDWNNLILNVNSSSFKRMRNYSSLNTYLTLDLVRFNITGFNPTLFSAISPNYLENISVQTEIIHGEVFKVRGELKYPLQGNINLFLETNQFIYYQSTLVMINCTFIFPEIIISDQFPTGLVNLTLNWTNTFEYGFFNQIILVHDFPNPESDYISLDSSHALIINQFNQFILNVSLFRDEIPFISNKTQVFLLKETESYFFFKIIDNNYKLHIEHITWEPGLYQLDIYAIEVSGFFTQHSINITVIESEILWNFEYLNPIYQISSNLTFLLYTYFFPRGSESYYPINDFKIELWIDETLLGIYFSDQFGLILVNVYPVIQSNISEFNLFIIGSLNGKIEKIDSLSFIVQNTSIIEGFSQVVVKEVSRTPIEPNKSFFVHYEVEYLTDASNWYYFIGTQSNNVLSSFIIRDSFVINTEIVNQSIIWNQQANPTFKDFLIIEYPGPRIYTTIELDKPIFKFKIDIKSNISISNFSISLNLQFLEFPFSNLSLLDSLSRDVTSSFPLEIDGPIIFIRSLNILEGKSIILTLLGQYETPEIINFYPFLENYSYNESMIGGWKFNCYSNFTYKIYYVIDAIKRENINSTHSKFENGTVIIITTLPRLSWNNTVYVYLCLYFSDYFIIQSIEQKIVINDPYPPELTVSFESSETDVIIHSFIFEPERASGIRNIIFNTEKRLIENISKPDYYLQFIFPRSDLKTEQYQIVVFDFANNNISLKFDLTRFFLENLPGFFENPVFFSIFCSLIFSTGIVLLRIYRKHKTTIL